MQIDELGCALDGRSLLQGVSFTIAAGACTVLLGPSGAGKSLIVRCLLGLAPTAAHVTGTLRWEAREVALSDRAALAGLRGRGLALVPQAAAASLDPMRTVGAQLRELNRLYERAGAEPAAQLMEVGLGHEFVTRDPSTLSGGQAQRVALALALACEPAVLVADEPTASLDSVAQAELLALLLARCEARGAALLLVSHDLAALTRRSMQAVVLDAGRVVATGSLATLVAAPPEPVTAAMVAAARKGMVV